MAQQKITTKKLSRSAWGYGAGHPLGAAGDRGKAGGAEERGGCWAEPALRGVGISPAKAAGRAT